MILSESDTISGKDMRIQADVFTPRQFVEACKAASGKDITLTEVDRAAFDACRSFPGVEETWCKSVKSIVFSLPHD